MIGKLIGAFAGSKLANSTRNGIDGPMGAALGVAAATVAKRVSLPMLVALTAGGWLVNKAMNKKEAETASGTAVSPVSTGTAPIAPASTATTAHPATTPR